jgi:tRNA-dihydrouridine synthase
MYKGEADWSYIAKVKANPRINIPIFGNGDIDSPQKAKEYKDKYGVDGIMIGRASIGYPWIFREIKQFLLHGTLCEPPTLTERIDAVTEHLTRAIDWKGEKLGVLETRRHYSNYFRGFPNIKEFRKSLVTLEDKNHILEVLFEMSQCYAGMEPVLSE